MDKSLIYIIIGLVGSLFAGYKWNLWSKAKLALDFMKARDEKDLAHTKYEIERTENELKKLDEERLRLRDQYNNEK